MRLSFKFAHARKLTRSATQKIITNFGFEFRGKTVGYSTRGQIGAVSRIVRRQVHDAGKKHLFPHSA